MVGLPVIIPFDNPVADCRASALCLRRFGTACRDQEDPPAFLVASSKKHGGSSLS